MPLLNLTHDSWPRRLLSLAAAGGLALAALLGLRALAEAASPRARPAAPAVTYTVNTTLDTPDHFLTDTLCLDAAGHCSLRAGLQQLDHDAGGTLVLPAGSYVLTNNAGGDLQLQKNIILNGAGPQTTIIQGNPAGWAHRILRVQDVANVVVSGVTISGGNVSGVGGGIDVVSGTLTLSNSVVTSNTATTNGGGIYNSAELSIVNSTIQSNTAATEGGGIYNDAINFAVSARADLSVTNSSILSNTAVSGGGLYNSDTNTPRPRGRVLVVNTNIDGNHASTGDGGGVYNSRGHIELSTGEAKGNSAAGGGALENNAGTAKVSGVTLAANRATNGSGGAVDNLAGDLQLSGGLIFSNHDISGGCGGGIASQLGTIAIANVFVFVNSAINGGGLCSYHDSGTITDSEMLLNQATTFGGGLDTVGSALTVTASTFDQNSADAGGGVYVLTGTLVISDSTLSNNLALATNGGGLDNDGAGSSLVALINSTVYSNASPYYGGGLANESGTLDLSNVTVAGNTADSNHDGFGAGGGLYNQTGTFELRNTLVAHNRDNSGAAPDCDGTLTSKDYNLIQSKLGCTIVGSFGNNIYHQDPLLGPLQYNGGPTNITTLALGTGSPAIDMGNPAGCKDRAGHLLTADQRGLPRSIDGDDNGTARCDIGAYEREVTLFLPSVWR